MYSQRVWTRFERKMKDGSVKKFRVQEVPPNMYEDVWEFIKINFLPDEPVSTIHGFMKKPEVLNRFKNFWTKYVLPKNYSVLCVEDIEHTSKPEIVGINNLYLSEQGKEKRPEGCCEPQKLLETFDALFGDYNTYEEFGVTKYLAAAGLAVNTKYRGMNIGLELLLARKPLCEHYGIKVTQTIFTATASQVIAAKAGFTTVIEKTYAELGRILEVSVPEKFKVCKVMVKVYD